MSFERPGDSELPLRERKKLQTKRRIRSTALDLVGQSRFDRVTVEQIAAHSNVSPSTVYRYFQTKEGIFLWDEYDEAVIEDFRNHLEEASPIEAMTEALAKIFARGLGPGVDEDALDYMAMLASVPQLQQSFAVQVDDTRRLLAAVVAEAGWPRLDSAVFAGAIVGMFLGAIESWFAAGGSEPLASVLDRATHMVVEGFEEVFATDR